MFKSAFILQLALGSGGHRASGALRQAGRTHSSFNLPSDPAVIVQVVRSGRQAGRICSSLHSLPSPPPCPVGLPHLLIPGHLRSHQVARDSGRIMCGWGHHGVMGWEGHMVGVSQGWMGRIQGDACEGSWSWFRHHPQRPSRTLPPPRTHPCRRHRSTSAPGATSTPTSHRPRPDRQRPARP